MESTTIKGFADHSALRDVLARHIGELVLITVSHRDLARRFLLPSLEQKAGYHDPSGALCDELLLGVIGAGDLSVNEEDKVCHLPVDTLVFLGNTEVKAVTGKPVKRLPGDLHWILVPDGIPFVGYEGRSRIVVGNEAVIRDAAYCQYRDLRRLAVALGYHNKMPEHRIYDHFLAGLRREYEGELKDLVVEELILAELADRIKAKRHEVVSKARCLGFDLQD